MAACPKNDAEKALHRILQKFGLTLNVPITYVELSSDCRMPCLMPSDYIQAFYEEGFLHKLLGGAVATSRMAHISKRFEL